MRSRGAYLPYASIPYAVLRALKTNTLILSKTTLYILLNNVGSFVPDQIEQRRAKVKGVSTLERTSNPPIQPVQTVQCTLPVLYTPRACNNKTRERETAQTMDVHMSWILVFAFRA